MTPRQIGGTARLQATARHLSWLSILLACQSALDAYGASVDTPAPDNIETRVLACTPCHGLRGQGTQDDYFPRLAGKPAGYLYNQLVAFRDGRRHYAPMNYLLEYQNDAYLRAIADYFMSQDPPYLPRHTGTTDRAVLAHGQALATRGGRLSRNPRMRRLSQSGLHRLTAWYSGPGGTATQLHQRATGRLALRNPHGYSPGLHATRVGASDGK
jgi:cytochrome c553